MSQELSDLQKLIEFMKRAEDAMLACEERYKRAKEQYEHFKDDVIPLFMRDLGLEEFTLETGETVSIETKYFGAITEAKRDRAIKWLEDNGEASLVKTAIGMSFGKGEMEQVDKLVLLNFLEEKEIDHDKKTAVHPSTLKSFIKRKMEAGEGFPYELFGVYVARETHVE